MQRINGPVLQTYKVINDAFVKGSDVEEKRPVDDCSLKEI